MRLTGGNYTVNGQKFRGSIEVTAEGNDNDRGKPK